MNASQFIISGTRRRKAMALVMVISAVALITILMVAILSVTQTEYKSTTGYVSARSAKQLADAATAIVEAQIQTAHNTAKTPSQRTIHATQPGMVRVYSSVGNFVRAHKLYSSSQMIVANVPETDLMTSQHQIPQTWKTLTARYVDLNEPVVRPGLTTGTTSVYFPIIDPRAAFNFLGSQTPSSTAATTQVEGFTYSKSTPATGGATVTYNEVVLPTEVGSDSTKLRLPMPVEWLYVLQDGTTGTLDTSNKFISSNTSVTPSTTNPIVGRVAFWTDDESCKVNVNTASEPTFMAPPYFYHERDYKWANFPGATGEYQRYPGHPATVALSAVMAPNIQLDPYAQGVSISNVVAIKEKIYDLAPKIAKGGSTVGTLPFVKDAFSATNGEGDPAKNPDSATARSERLFASVDELLFTDSDYSSTTGRVAARYLMPGGSGRALFDHDTLERTRFFLTAHSRAPEFSSHGMPRIAMWPVADEGLGVARRSSFDNMIALCATLRSKGASSGAAVDNSYIFRRAQPHHPTHDVTGNSATYGSSTGLQRNSKLLDYLYAEMSSLQYPATSSLGGASTFAQKYGTDNVAQMAVQFFDYIRCTNLYDGVLARNNDGTSGNGLSGTNLYTKNDQMYGSQFTYTNFRVTRKATGSLKDGTQVNSGNDFITDDAAVFPGHGQVTPAIWQKGSTSYRGFGRMFTLSEVGFQFICTADGQNDDYAVNFKGTTSGGGSAPKTDPTLDSLGVNYQHYGNNLLDDNPKNDGKSRWYSNFPPLVGGATPAMLYGVVPTPANGQYHPSKHPGYDPNNWNMSLANNTPLAPDEKRIQCMLMLETFCPMAGWTKFYPEYSIVLDGNFIAGIKLNGQSLYDTTQDVVVKSNGNIYEATDCYSLGGHAGPTAIAGSRGARPVSGTGPVLMPSDPSFVTGNTAGHNALTNYGVNSNFITVKRNQPMQLSFGSKTLVIKLYDSHRYQEQSLQPVQVINISFDNDSGLPVPALVYSRQRQNIDALPDPAANPNNNELNFVTKTDSFGRIIYWRSLQGPHWWCFNSEGCLGRLDGRANPAYDGTASQPFWSQAPAPYAPGADQTALRQTLRGRLDTAAGRVDGPNGSAQGFSIIPRELALNATGSQLPTDADTGRPWSGSDVIRTMVPAVGDYRLIMARYNVPPTMWKRHPIWDKTAGQGLTAPKTVHSFTTHWTYTEPGAVLPTDAAIANPAFTNLVNKNQLLVSGAAYSDARVPDLPPDNSWSTAANSYGDFDNGIASTRDGAYVNKPDEGNFFAGEFTRNNIKKFYRSGYFYEPWHNSDDWRSGVYMTPNRMVSSPVMFGSLPTGVWPGQSTSSNSITGSGVSFSDGYPWQTLLFRPYSKSNSQGKSVSQGHPGDNNPRDHFLLDLFFMPVVEPYAISEPLSVAGRINLNFQIMPFTNIRRATGLHALMKGEFITAIPNNGDVNNAKGFQSSPSQQQKWDVYWDEKNYGKYWHRPINVTETLVQFDEKFNGTAAGPNHAASRFRGLFRTASQICEMHLIPDVSKGASSGNESVSAVSSSLNPGSRQNAMDTWWQAHSPTGDNTRERPYSNLYSRVTTRSNTFRVHVRAQLIRKARSTAVDVYDPTKDAVFSEYRGSTLIERYIDPNDNSAAMAIPDYAASGSPFNEIPLESFYKFRALESKRFSP